MPRTLRNLLVLGCIVAVPLLFQIAADRWMDSYQQVIFFRIALNITLAAGLSLIIGFAGQFSLGHAGFMSAGAFFSGLFGSRILAVWIESGGAEWIAGDAASAILIRAAMLLVLVIVGALAAAIASFVVGLPSLRLRGDYLAIATLGFGEIAYNLLLIHLQKTHYDTAYYVPYTLDSLPINLASSSMLALFSIVIVRNLVNSTSGRALPAIREDEIAASAVGIRTTRYKLIAFVVGSMLAGAAGVLETYQTLIVNPASYRFDRSIEMIVPVVLGGSGSLTGSVLAAAGFTYLLETLRELPVPQYRTIVFAAVLVLFMILRPQGLMGRWELFDVWRWVRGRWGPKGRDIAPPVDDSPAPKLRKDTVPATLTCRNLTIRFGGLTAVNDFQLVLRPREIVGLIGPNGAGKTTCFNMITGVYQPTSGGIFLGDKSLVGLGPAAINNRGIARTFQNIRLFAELTVLDNVRIALHAHLRTGLASATLRTSAFYRDERTARVQAMQLLDLFGLTAVAGELARNLPYGDQRRLEIARALATHPTMLCLDEPAAGMNPAEKRTLMELIRSIRDRFALTILLIEHDMKVVMGVCERIIVLDHGETIAEGVPDEIRDNPRVVEAYLGEPVKLYPPR